MNAIEAREVRKIYRRYGRRTGFGTLKSALLSGSVLRQLKADAVFEALKGVSFDVPSGTTFGIIGRNGSGKSTMLKLIAGIGKPTSGTVSVRGRVSALIELGAGFHPEISGRENVFINGMMLGLAKRDIARRFDDIVAFAEIEDFIDAPVKTYSSGMYMRLGFAVAIHVDPDVLLVDEVLAVGDETFTHKCFDKLADLRRRGRTILLVTHSLDLVTRFCDLALWLDGGVARAQGDPKRVIDAYLMDVARAEDEALGKAQQPPVGTGTPQADRLLISARVPSTVAASGDGAAAAGTNPAEPEDMFKSLEGRWGTREAEIAGVDLRRTDGTPAHVFQSGDAMDICLRVVAHQRLTDFVFGIGIFNLEGVCCYGTNTAIEGAHPAELDGAAEVTFHVERLDLIEGTYKLDVAVHRENGAPYDYHRLLYAFRVSSPAKDTGIFRPAHRWSFAGGIRLTGL
jgi:ABC-type polysaccharide/polyol phosphate transport system ATPase subunit